MSEPGTPPFDLDELRAQVEQLDGGIWRVEKTLRSTPYGETQLVYRNGSEAGTFIRKYHRFAAARSWLSSGFSLNIV